MSVKTWKTKNGYTITRLLAGRSNVFLVTDGVSAILVDTGPRFMRKKLFKNLSTLNTAKIDYLILTHSHFDHAANAAAIKSEYGAKVIIHQFEEGNLAKGENAVIKGTNFFTRMIVKLASGILLKKLNFEPCSPDILADDHFSLKDSGFNAYILHTPGHTAGSMSLIVDDEIAIVGDEMFGIFKGSVFPPYAGDAMQLIESWGKLLDTGCRWFLPSHGSANTRKLVEREWRKRR
jgi:glyoxylase-like metal-dependent hydrolase (beta-lactamase superfamily II)